MFDNIQEYYDYLEKDKSFIFNIDLSNRLINLRDKTNDIDIKTYCSYESFFNDFMINNGRVSPKITLAGGEEYPTYQLFEDNLKYIQLRAEVIVNPKYKAKYNHLLWGKFKNNKYAYEAIDNYLNFLQVFPISVEDHLANIGYANSYKNLFALSQFVNYKKDETLQLLQSILGVKRIDVYKEYLLMKFIVEEGKKINTDVFQNFFNYSNEVIEESVYLDLIEDYLQILIAFSQKLRLPSKPYHNKLAEFYMKQSEQQSESFIVHDIYLRALKQYHKANNKKKVEEFTVLIEKAKQNINFKLIKVEHQDEMTKLWWDETSRITDILTQNHESKDIFEYIILNERMFPKAESLDDYARPVMYEFVSVMTFDINRNISDTDKNGISIYFTYIRNFSLHHLWMIFSKGLKNGKVSYQSLIDFLSKHSWYGQDFTFVNADGAVQGFNWIELLSPALFNFFNQSEIDIKTNKNSDQGYILSIDSLVIKFEGLLREFSRMIGAQTVEIKENGTQERISFEKLLENEKLKETLPEDDIALFKFLFTTSGMNLRNNVAHCFYKVYDYSAGMMFLLIAALLRLGNYKFAPKN